MARVLVPLAPGFEEIEAVTIIDVLRRADVEVVIASVSASGAVTGAPPSGAVTGSHAITVHAPVALADVAAGVFDLVVLPGGEPGTTHLAADPVLADVLRRQAAAGRPLAAICAAPRILAALGLLGNRAATSHPSVEAPLRAAGAQYEASRVVVADGIVTSRGPGTALEFAFALLELLNLNDRAARLRIAMLAAP